MIPDVEVLCKKIKNSAKTCSLFFQQSYRLNQIAVGFQFLLLYYCRFSNNAK